MKKRTTKTLLWSEVLQGSESSTTRQENIIKWLEAFEMWTWRRMKKISWKDHT